MLDFQTIRPPLPLPASLLQQAHLESPPKPAGFRTSISFGRTQRSRRRKDETAYRGMQRLCCMERHKLRFTAAGANDCREVLERRCSVAAVWSSFDTVPIPPPVVSPSNEPAYSSPGELVGLCEARAHEQYLMQTQATADWIRRAAIARADQRNRRLTCAAVWHFTRGPTRALDPGTTATTRPPGPRTIPSTRCAGSAAASSGASRKVSEMTRAPRV